MTRRVLGVLAVLWATIAPVLAQDVSVGVQVGYGVQQPLGDEFPTHLHIVLGEVQINAALMGDTAHPRLELVNALLLGQSVHRPGSRFTLGITDTFRLHLKPRHKADPFFEAGAGISSSAMRIRELTGWLQYVLQLGIGVRVRVASAKWLTVGYRFVHLSNNYTSPPNEGLNCHVISVGFALRR